MADTGKAVEGESGHSPATESEATGSAPATASGTELKAGDMTFEVKLQALAALESIARRLAGLIHSKHHAARVVLADGETLNALRLYRQVDAKLTVLLGAVKAAEDPAADLGLTALNTQAGAVIELISRFQASQTVAGQEVAVSARAFRTMLVGQLVANDIAALVLPQDWYAPAGSNGVLDRVVQLVRLRATALEATGGEPSWLATAVDGLMALLTNAQKLVLPQLLLGEAVAGFLADRTAAEGEPADAKPKTLLLVAEIEAAGGNVRVRRSLWKTLFSGNQVSVGGGAAVSYLLLRAPDIAPVEGGTLRQHEDYVRVDVNKGLGQRLTSPAQES